MFSDLLLSCGRLYLRGDSEHQCPNHVLTASWIYRLQCHTSQPPKAASLLDDYEHEHWRLVPVIREEFLHHLALRNGEECSRRHPVRRVVPPPGRGNLYILEMKSRTRQRGA